MNKDIFEGKWHEIKGSVKEKWGKLTDEDVTQINGKYEQLIGTLQKKYGYEKEEAEREINNWKYEKRKEGCSSCDSGKLGRNEKYCSGEDKNKDDENFKKRKIG